MNLKARMTLTGLVIALVGAILLTFAGIETIDAGEVGVVKRWGRVTGRVLDPGAHVVVPVADDVLKYDTKKVIYEARRQVPKDTLFGSEDGVYIDHTVDTNTSDGQQVNVYFTIRFSVDPTQATGIAQEVGSENLLVDKVIRPEARIWTRNVPRQFEAAELYSKDVVEVQTRIAEALRPVYEDNGVILDSVGIREIEFADEYVRAIETKQIEAVKVETEQNKAEQAKFEKERRITQAQASAEEQRLQQETLGQEVLEKLLIDKWDGKYPKTLVVGGGQEFILPLPENQE